MTWNWKSTTCAALLSVGAAALGTLTVTAQEAPAPGTAAPAAGDHGADVRALGAEDFAERQRAHDRLRAAGESARAALEAGARSTDAQIRWSSRRLLRLLSATAVEPRAAETERGLRFEDDEAPATGERDPGEEPRARFRDPWGEDPLEAFHDIERHMAEVRERMAELEARTRDGQRWLEERGSTPGASVRRQVIRDDGRERIALDIDEEGAVDVSIASRGSGGVLEERTWHAASMEALAREHPEVHERVKDMAGGTLTFRFDRGPGRRAGDPSGLPFGSLPAPLEAPNRGPALGVRVLPVPELLRAHVALPEDAGVVVEEVLAGTLAGRLGLLRLDVLLAVNGLPVGTAGDLRAAVGAVPEGGEVRIGVLRKGAPMELRGTR